MYYLGSASDAEVNLDTHIELLKQRISNGSAKDRKMLFVLLSHNQQLKGMIARDQLHYPVAERYFHQASLVAQEAECAELNALAMGRQAIVCLQQGLFDQAVHTSEVAKEIAKHAPASLRLHLTIGYAEAQGNRQDYHCLQSLDEAKVLARHVDTQDDHLLLFHATRSTEQAIKEKALVLLRHARHLSI